jgi:hypothetical protein
VSTLPAWFWWGYGTFGVVAWALVGFIWWRGGDFWNATDIVCGMVANLAWGAGFAVAMFLLLSTAGAGALGLVVVPIVGVAWVVHRLREK